MEDDGTQQSARRSKEAAVVKALASGVFGVTVFVGIMWMAPVTGVEGEAAGQVSQGSQGTGVPGRTVTREQYEGWKKTLSNWGRWGKDDQIGTMNLVTPAKMREAAALVKEGFSVSLASAPDEVKAVDNPNPYERTMQGIGIDRWLGVAFHGQTHTHLDAMAHVNENGVFYNGYQPDPDAVTRANRHSRNGIDNLRNGVFTRGVLMDIPRLKGVPYLAQGTSIHIEDLEAWEKQAGIKVGPGDALLIRTGVWALRKEIGPFARGRNAKDAGLDPSVIPWLKQRDIAILGSDHPQYVSPSDLPGAAHDFTLLYLGVHLIDNADLEALADAAAARKRWDFLLTMAPIPVVGGTGSPINPIATF
jgi:kynurenine formamidase